MLELKNICAEVTVLSSHIDDDVDERQALYVRYGGGCGSDIPAPLSIKDAAAA